LTEVTAEFNKLKIITPIVAEVQKGSSVMTTISKKNSSKEGGNGETAAPQFDQENPQIPSRKTTINEK
jgi:hypothetical protein